MMSLAHAILFGTIDEVRHALESGEHPEELDDYGFTPLIESAIANKVAVAELLLKAGAQVDNTDASGRTALHWAVDNANLDLCQLLLKHKADPNAYTSGSQPLLIYPLLRHQDQLKKLLIDYGASINFAQDFISAKLLGHRYELAGKVDIFAPNKKFIELEYEGFFLEFTLDIVCHSLERYRNHFSARQVRHYFNELHAIISAFINARHLLKYQRYTIDIEQFSDQIHPLLQEELLLLPLAYEGHAVSFIKYKDYLIRCDRGENSKREGSVVIYRINNHNAWSLAFVKQLLYKRQTRQFIVFDIKDILSLQPIDELPLSSQLIGNCSWANVEASIPAILFLLMFTKKNQKKSRQIYKKPALDFYQQWLQWDKDRALEESIHSFQYASAARKASKAAQLVAVVFQTCRYENDDDLKKVDQILRVLNLPQYHYLLKSYVTVYWEMRKTKQGLNFLNLLDACGVKL